LSIERERFDRVKSLWSETSSWAVWRTISPEEKPKSEVGDRTVLDPESNPALLGSLKPEFVMLGLNAATREMDPEPWSNFHDGRSMANDFKIRFAFENTPYWGAYMTDVFVDLHETDSGKVAKYVKANPQVLGEQLARLERELDDLEAVDPLLIAFGGQVYSILRRHLGNKYRIVKVPHYAHRISKTSYRARVLDSISDVFGHAR
jgi:hypothetical protein